jgi:hypothetical protein
MGVRSRTYVRRWVGAARLAAATFEEVEADRGATRQAALTVALAGLAVGIGVTGTGGGRELVWVCGAALVAWAAWSLLTYQIGIELLPAGNTRADLGELLRTTGFASTPGVFSLGALVPGAQAAVLTLVAVWLLLAMIVAVRQALDYASTFRAIAVCVVGWALAIAMVLGVGFFM